MQPVPSQVTPGHPDFPVLSDIKAEILRLSGGEAKLAEVFPALTQEAMEYVLDPVTTGRTKLKLLDNVEKTFVGLKIEHFFREFLDVPKGIRDLVIGGVDVDVKNTVRGNWMIPQETYSVSGPCVLIACDEDNHRCWLGLLLARPAYLNAANRDKKRSVSSKAFANILWLVEGMPFPESHWNGFDMARFRELRKLKGGTKRVAQFFRENLRKRVHRKVIQSLLFDQDDYMKRVRGNGGARDVLRKEKIAVLSGYYDTQLLAQIGILGVMPNEMIAVNPFTAAEEDLFRAHAVID